MYSVGIREVTLKCRSDEEARVAIRLYSYDGTTYTRVARFNATLPSTSGAWSWETLKTSWDAPLPSAHLLGGPGFCLTVQAAQAVDKGRTPPQVLVKPACAAVIASARFSSYVISSAVVRDYDPA